MKSKHIIMTTISATLMVLASACSERSFTASEGSNLPLCAQGRTEVKCVPCEASESCSSKYDYEVNAQGQITDVLFVVDNSGSMYEDQVEMGTKFPNFLNTLSTLDYRIAITTTDVRTAENIRNNTNRPGANNGNGAFQDGNLISFSNGAPYLSGNLSTSVEQSYFLDAITREETRQCDLRNSGHHPSSSDNCPSGDERGVLAAAMTLEKNPSDFIRPTGHLALVILSDEDEGSDGIIADNRENPTQFVNYFRSLYPNKSIKAHSIIIEPNSTEGRACYNKQYTSLAGQYGTIYQQLSQITSGMVGSICADDYTNHLRQIGDSVAQVREVLPCRPLNKQISVSFNPQPSYQVTHSYNSFQNEVLFSRSLPQGTKIRFQFTCAQ